MSESAATDQSTAGSESDLSPVDHLAVTRDSYRSLGYDDYRWAENPEPVPLASLSRPLSDARVAVIASGGIYRQGQVAFHHHDDVSHRRIPTDTPTEELRTSHFAYDQTNARTDPNVVLPLDPLRALQQQGVIGEFTSHALTFMGGIYSQRKLHETLTPALCTEVQAMGADAVLLVPV